MAREYLIRYESGTMSKELSVQFPLKDAIRLADQLKATSIWSANKMIRLMVDGRWRRRTATGSFV